MNFWWVGSEIAKPVDKDASLTSAPRRFRPEVDQAGEVEDSISRATTWYHYSVMSLTHRH